MCANCVVHVPVFKVCVCSKDGTHLRQHGWLCSVGQSHQGLRRFPQLCTYQIHADCRSPSRHQLGLHEAASASHLDEIDRVVGHRAYTALRCFDAYVTCSLGLPRTLRAIEPAGNTTVAPDIGHFEMLLAADANIELLDIMGATVEKAYFTDVTAKKGGPTLVQFERVREGGQMLERWAQRYPDFALGTHHDLTSCTK